ncbi:MAG: thiamine-phosphate kinase [Armatimonadota bacterium]
MKISEFGGENALVNLISEQFSAAPGDNLALGVGDDAALVDIGDWFLVVTTDILIEGTHFRMDINEPYLLGWKGAAVNISDVAAMGGEPTYSFISIGLPDIDKDVVVSIYEGLHDANTAFGSAIAGGDTVASESGIVINVTQLGIVEKNLAAFRGRACPGDVVLVTNTLGDSLAGLQLLLKMGLEEARRACSRCVEKHLKPEPRVAEARAAVKTGKVHAMMDLSDGLAADLPRLCAASKTGARIRMDALPLSDEIYIAAARLDADPVTLSTAGGEDYELLITCAREDAPTIIQAMRTAGSNASIIGEITCEPNRVCLVDSTGKDVPFPKGWEHF